ncbi:metalloregulator ArsR/SmtB family transcription factor [Halorutilales archaeon Cl-col2-1]
MESSQLFKILGNENRRRIIDLLAYKPCYVTEISDYLGVSPKAVIDHLSILEDAGIVESEVDDRRRKYFYIARNLRLEVSISPYSFGVKSAYPNPNFKANYEHIKINYSYESEKTSDIVDLVNRLERLEKIENELSLAQRYIQSKITEVMSEIEDKVEGTGENKLQIEIIDELVDSGASDAERLSREMGLRPDVVRESLRSLEERGIVTKERNGEDVKWKLND